MITMVPALPPLPESVAEVSGKPTVVASSASALAGSDSTADSEANDDFHGANGSGSLASVAGVASGAASTAGSSSPTGSLAAGSRAAGPLSGVHAVASRWSHRGGGPPHASAAFRLG